MTPSSTAPKSDVRSILCANCATRSRRGFTPSMKMRHALWTLHIAQGGSDGTFHEFYIEKMGQLIDLVYDKIPSPAEGEHPI